MALGPLTTVEVPAGRVLLVPCGSTEQHGPHLPLDTDTRIATAVCEAVADVRADVVVAPALAYGSAGEHAGFAGTLSIGLEVTEAVLVELGRSAIPDIDAPAPFTAVVFASGHAGNATALARATARLTAEGRSAAWWVPRVAGGDAHAGRIETSLLLHLAPDVVRLDRAAAGAVEPIADLLPALRDGGVAAVSPNGVLGDPAGASAAEGADLLAQLRDDLAATVDGCS